MDIDIYDFDKTIVPFDSGTLFCLYCFIHYPWTLIFLPLDIIGIILVGLGIINFSVYKKFCYLYVSIIPLERAVKKFWDRYEDRVNKWFFDRKRYSVVISASPDFLVEEMQKRLGFEVLIASSYNRKNGIIQGKNCRGREKVRRLYEKYTEEEINIIDVYSDSLKHDKPIFSLGRNCYHIEKGEVKPFDFEQVYNQEKKEFKSKVIR